MKWFAWILMGLIAIAAVAIAAMLALGKKVPGLSSLAPKNGAGATGTAVGGGNAASTGNVTPKVSAAGSGPKRGVLSRAIPRILPNLPPATADAVSTLADSAETSAETALIQEAGLA